MRSFSEDFKIKVFDGLEFRDFKVGDRCSTCKKPITPELREVSVLVLFDSKSEDESVKVYCSADCRWVDQIEALDKEEWAHIKSLFPPL